MFFTLYSARELFLRSSECMNSTVKNMTDEQRIPIENDEARLKTISIDGNAIIMNHPDGNSTGKRETVILHFQPVKNTFTNSATQFGIFHCHHSNNPSRQRI